MSSLKDILATAQNAVSNAADAAALDIVRVQYLGKKGELTGLLKALGKLPADERPAAGAEINKAKEALQGSIAERKAALDDASINDTAAPTTGTTPYHLPSSFTGCDVGCSSHQEDGSGRNLVTCHLPIGSCTEAIHPRRIDLIPSGDA